jgi:TetR/AcrR family transcriptional regulator, regulator of autoinduction and epiphytic fitness
MTAPMPDPALAVDGRRARRSRSRDRAVDALLDLLGEGVLRPTAQQVAERSGVSLRSIFRIFDDVESLNTAASARQLSRIRHLFIDVIPTGTLADRIAQVVAINGQLYESIAPIRRAALRYAPESPALQEQLARARGWVRGEVERVFATELATAPRDTASAVELALSFEAWDQLRAAQGVSPTRAAATVRRVVTALLTPPS